MEPIGEAFDDSRSIGIQAGTYGEFKEHSLGCLAFSGHLFLQSSREVYLSVFGQ